MIVKRKTILFSTLSVLAITIISLIAIHSIKKTSDEITSLEEINWDI